MIEDDNYDEDDRCEACHGTECCGVATSTGRSWWLVVDASDGLILAVKHSKQAADLRAKLDEGNATVIEVVEK